jgi:hypothetical protein
MVDGREEEGFSHGLFLLSTVHYQLGVQGLKARPTQEFFAIRIS